jgi:hypothetical protein
MASTGNVFPGTGSSVARSTGTAWTGPTNVGSDNATDATCNSGSAGSAYLVASNFDFSSLPSDATILGFTVRVEASEHSAGTETLNAQLQGSTAALVGSSKTASLNGTGKIVYTYGGTADMWGTSLTAPEVKDSDFGVRVWFTTTHDVRIDYVTVAVEYSTGVNEALTTSVSTSAVGTLLPDLGQALQGLSIASATGVVTGPETHGVQASFDLGSAVVSLTLALSGAAITAGQGSISPNLDGAVPLVGESVAANIQTIAPNVSKALTGSAVTVSIGDVTLTINPSTTAGQVITPATGTVVAEGAGGLTVHISGVEASFEQGSVVSSGTGLGGQAITPAAGTATPSTTLAITGEAITASQGTVFSGQDADDTYILSSLGTVVQSISVELEGDEITSAQGSVAVTGDDLQALTGEAATPAAGTVAPVVAVAISGVSASFAQENMGAPGGASLSGAEIVATAGNVFLDGDRSLALTGQSVSVLDGQAVTSYLAFATGQELTLTQQTIGPYSAALSGVSIESATGRLLPPDTARPGKSKGKGRDKKIVVTIDEQQFIVESEEEAVALLEQAAEVAAETAALQVAKVAESSKRGRKKALASAREALQTPVIAVEDFDAQSYIAKITQTYAEALKEIETKKKAEDKRTQDEEDAIILNLLNL